MARRGAELPRCVGLVAAREAVQRVIPRRDANPTEIPLTPRMHQILGRAKQMAPEPAQITPSALLLALVADPDGVGTQVLCQHGPAPEKAREAVDRLTPPSQGR